MDEEINEKIKKSGIKESIISLQGKLLGRFLEYVMFRTYDKDWKSEIIKKIKSKPNKWLGNYASIIETVCPHVGKNYKLIKQEKISKSFCVKDIDVTAAAALIRKDFLMQCCAYKEINTADMDSVIKIVKNNRNTLQHITDNGDYYQACDNALNGISGFIELLEKYNWEYDINEKFTAYLAENNEKNTEKLLLQTIKMELTDYRRKLYNLKRKRDYKDIRFEFIDNDNRHIKNVKFHIEMLSDKNFRASGCEDGKGFNISLEPEEYNIVCDSVPREYSKFGTERLEVKASDNAHIVVKITLNKTDELYNKNNLKKTKDAFTEIEFNTEINSDFDELKQDILFNDDNLQQYEDSEKQLELGKKYYNGERYKEAFNCFMESAKCGDPVAQNCLGILYYEGKGIEKNDEEAVEWYTKAAEQGNVDAIINLADMYYYKENASEDEAKKAFTYYENLAERGDAYVQNQLANCYATGFGVDTNIDKAIELYEQLMEQGNTEAIFNLAIQYYCYGYYTDEMNDILNSRWKLRIYKYNVDRAFECFCIAAKQGNKDAIACLAWMYLYGVGTEKNLDLAVDYFTESGYRDLKFSLFEFDPEHYSYCDEFEYGVEHLRTLDIYKNIIPESIIFLKGEEYWRKHEYEKAVKYLRLITSDWYLSSKANYLLINCYENRLGVDDIDRDYVLSLYKNVANYSIYMSIKLGNMFFEGQGVEQNYEEAIKWYDSAEAYGVLSAYVLLGDRYYYGEKVDRDHKKAIEWYEKAVNLWSVPYIIQAEKLSMGKYMQSEEVSIDEYIYNIGAIIKTDKEIINRKYTGMNHYGNVNFEKEKYIYARKRLGDIYYNGEGTRRNSAEGIKNYEEAAELGDVEIAWKLLVIYYHGTVIDHDYEKAYYWLTKIDKKSYINADILINLAEIFMYGKYGVKQDYEKASKCFEMIDVDNSVGEIQNKLAKYYEQKDEKRALEIYEKAAAQNCKEAMANLGRLHYKKGEYVAALECYNAALKLYNLSSEVERKDVPEKYNRLKLLIEKTKKIISNDD